MQDIIPPRRVARGSLRPPARPALRPQGRAVEGIFYTRRTTVINSPSGVTETVVDETITSIPALEPAPMTRPIEHLTPDAKSEVLQKALAMAERELKKERRQRRDIKRFSIVLVTAVFVLVTGYVSIDTWITNNQVKAETTQSSDAGSGGTWTPDEEGKDETVPTAASVASYAVAPSLPRALYIDKLKIVARILPMGVNKDGSVQAPRNIFDAGWYTGSVKPGETGAMFVDGHASGPTREGLFAYLDTLVDGDEIRVEKGDGSTLKYRVVHTETKALGDVDMKKMLMPYNEDAHGLNLMTCTGKWLADQKTYDQRVLVWAEEIR